MNLAQDLRFAVRSLKNNPGFTILAVLTLALGIGATTLVFSVLDAVLLRPFNYADAERIVLVWSSDVRNGNSRGQVSSTEIGDVRKQVQSLEEIANFADWTPTLSGAGEAERLDATQVGDGFFKVMGTRPLLGRFFTPEEQVEGKDRVVVLSYGLWQTRFGGDRKIVGKTVILSTVPHTVVGVTTPDFAALPSTLVKGGALYRPVAEPYNQEERASRHLRAIGKLKAGVSAEQAAAELDSIGKRLAAEYPTSNASMTFRLTSLYEDSVAELRPTLIATSAAVLLLLLIACANVANLMLARASARHRELAVRGALGASRGRLVVQMLAESFVLALLGGAIGVIAAVWSTSLVQSLAGSVASQLASASVNLQVLWFSVAVTVGTAFVFGLVPALQSSAVDVNDALKSSGRSVSASRSRLRGALVVTEIAMALVLLIASGLLIKSFQRLLSVDPGFVAENRITTNVWLPYARYQQPAKQIAFYRQLLGSMKTAPQIESAALVSNPPMGNFDGRVFQVEEHMRPWGEVPEAQSYFISAEYFHTMGIPVASGRAFTEADHETAPPVIAINQTMAQKMFPGENPLGKRIGLYRGRKANVPEYDWRTVVGLVGDLKHYGPDQSAPMQMYIPYLQRPVSYMTMVAHVRQSPAAGVEAIRQRVNALDSDVALFRVMSMEEVLSESVATRRFALELITGFGVAALLLGLIGIYGLISYTVSQRTHEIGIRMAVGAQRANIVRLILGQGFRFALFGLAIGTAVAMWGTSFLAVMLFEVKPLDWTVYLSIPLLLLFCVLFAAYIPARRASKLEPLEALRYE